MSSPNRILQQQRRSRSQADADTNEALNNNSTSNRSLFSNSNDDVDDTSNNSGDGLLFTAHQRQDVESAAATSSRISHRSDNNNISNNVLSLSSRRVQKSYFQKSPSIRHEEGIQQQQQEKVGSTSSFLGKREEDLVFQDEEVYMVPIGDATFARHQNRTVHMAINHNTKNNTRPLGSNRDDEVLNEMNHENNDDENDEQIIMMDDEEEAEIFVGTENFAILPQPTSFLQLPLHNHDNNENDDAAAARREHLFNFQSGTNGDLNERRIENSNNNNGTTRLLVISPVVSPNRYQNQISNNQGMVAISPPPPFFQNQQQHQNTTTTFGSSASLRNVEESGQDASTSSPSNVHENNYNSNQRNHHQQPRSITSIKHFPYFISNLNIGSGGSAKILIGRKLHSSEIVNTSPPSSFSSLSTSQHKNQKDHHHHHHPVIIHNPVFDIDASLWVALKQPFTSVLTGRNNNNNPTSATTSPGEVSNQGSVNGPTKQHERGVDSASPSPSSQTNSPQGALFLGSRRQSGVFSTNNFVNGSNVNAISNSNQTEEGNDDYLGQHCSSSASTRKIPLGFSPESTISKNDIRSLLAKGIFERRLMRFIPKHPGIVNIFHATKDYMVMPLMDGDLAKFIQERKSSNNDDENENVSQRHCLSSLFNNSQNGVAHASSNIMPNNSKNNNKKNKSMSASSSSPKISRGGILSEDQVRKILFVLVKAIHHLHQNNIVHRDIKPSNILVKKVLVVHPEQDDDEDHEKNYYSDEDSNNNCDDNPKFDRFEICLTDFSAAHPIPQSQNQNAKAMKKSPSCSPAPSVTEGNNSSGGNSSTATNSSSSNNNHNRNCNDQMNNLWNRGSPGYRPPEILVGRQAALIRGLDDRLVVKAADMWGVGCVAAELLLGTKQLFSRGCDLEDYARIQHLLVGREKKQQQSGKNSLGDCKNISTSASSASSSEGRLFKDLGILGVSKACIDLLKSLLALDPRDRITSAAALEHTFFQSPELLVALDTNEIKNKKYSCEKCRQVQDKNKTNNVNCIGTRRNGKVVQGHDYAASCLSICTCSSFVDLPANVISSPHVQSSSNFCSAGRSASTCSIPNQPPTPTNFNNNNNMMMSSMQQSQHHHHHHHQRNNSSGSGVGTNINNNSNQIHQHHNRQQQQQQIFVNGRPLNFNTFGFTNIFNPQCASELLQHSCSTKKQSQHLQQQQQQNRNNNSSSFRLPPPSAPPMQMNEMRPISSLFSTSGPTGAMTMNVGQFQKRNQNHHQLVTQDGASTHHFHHVEVSPRSSMQPVLICNSQDRREYSEKRKLYQVEKGNVVTNNNNTNQSGSSPLSGFGSQCFSATRNLMDAHQNDDDDDGEEDNRKNLANDESSNDLQDSSSLFGFPPKPNLKTAEPSPDPEFPGIYNVNSNSNTNSKSVVFPNLPSSHRSGAVSTYFGNFDTQQQNQENFGNGNDDLVSSQEFKPNGLLRSSATAVYSSTKSLREHRKQPTTLTWDSPPTSDDDDGENENEVQIQNEPITFCQDSALIISASSSSLSPQTILPVSDYNTGLVLDPQFAFFGRKRRETAIFVDNNNNNNCNNSKSTPIKSSSNKDNDNQDCAASDPPPQEKQQILQAGTPVRQVYDRKILDRRRLDQDVWADIKILEAENEASQQRQNEIDEEIRRYQQKQQQQQQLQVQQNVDSSDEVVDEEADRKRKEAIEHFDLHGLKKQFKDDERQLFFHHERIFPSQSNGNHNNNNGIREKSLSVSRTVPHHQQHQEAVKNNRSGNLLSIVSSQQQNGISSQRNLFGGNDENDDDDTDYISNNHNISNNNDGSPLPVALTFESSTSQAKSSKSLSMTSTQKYQMFSDCHNNNNNNFAPSWSSTSSPLFLSNTLKNNNNSNSSSNAVAVASSPRNANKSLVKTIPRQQFDENTNNNKLYVDAPRELDDRIQGHNFFPSIVFGNNNNQTSKQKQESNQQHQSNSNNNNFGEKPSSMFGNDLFSSYNYCYRDCNAAASSSSTNNNFHHNTQQQQQQQQQQQLQNFENYQFVNPYYNSANKDLHNTSGTASDATSNQNVSCTMSNACSSQNVSGVKEQKNTMNGDDDMANQNGQHQQGSTPEGTGATLRLDFT